MRKTSNELKLIKFSDECELLIRQGKSVLARKSLLQLDRTTIQRSLRARFANLFRRSGMPEISLRLLNRIVRPQTGVFDDSSPEEKTDYAAALIAIGASTEGLKLLSVIPKQDYPDALLQAAIGHITRWEYLESIPMLQRLIEHPKATHYQRVVGRVNLASALLTERQIGQAEHILELLQTEISGLDEFGLVSGNVFELTAQAAIYHGDHGKARHLIAAASKHQSLHTGITSLLLAKTKAINNALDPAHRAHGIEELQAVVAESQRLKRWETCREAHFYLSRVLRDNTAFLKIYFGTPYENYRRRILRDYPQAPTIPSEYVCHLYSPFKSYPLVFNTMSGELEGASGRLSFASLPHKLLNLLATDFFRPFRVSKIFAELHPDEYFNPFTSPDRIHLDVVRLRRELEEQNIPLNVVREREGYFLSSSGAIALRVYKEPCIGDRNEMYMEKFRKTWDPQQEFSKALMEGRLNLSTRAVSRILKWAKDNSKVTCKRHGNGKVFKLVG